MAKKRAVPVQRELPLNDAVSEAFGEFTGLAEEMRSWADNLEEKFSATDKYARVSEAADTIEGLSEPTYPESLKDVKVSFQDLPQKRRGYSRADRCGQACYIMDTCIGVLDEIIEDEKAAQELKDDAESMRDEIDTAKSEAECVEFPGMYG